MNKIGNWNKGKWQERVEDIQENWNYYEGDTFQFWTGPMPPIDDPHYQEVLSEIEKGFISNNLIKECVDRYVSALVSLTPQWYLKSNSTTTEVGNNRPPEVAEGEKLLQQWLEQMNRYVALHDCDDDSTPLTQAVLQMLVCGRGYLRLYQPKRYKESNAQLYQKIRLHCPVINSVTVNRDDDGEITAITYSYKGGKETQELDPGKGTLKFTITSKEETQTWESNFDGRWTIYELRAAPLINTDIKREQNAINKALTMLGRNLDMAGFLERVITNAQLPGHWIDDPNRPGKQKFVPSDKPLELGPGKTTFLSGAVTKDGQILSPNVVYRDPVDITTFEKSVAIFATRLYLGFNQGHILAGNDGSINGISRVQMRQDAAIALDHKAPIIENAFACILEVVLRYIDPIKFKNVTAVVKLRKNINYITPEDNAESRSNYQAGLISRSTAMSKIGIEDTDAEIALINEELESEIKRAAGTGLIQKELEQK
ncbi:MAG TPA: phage portal protein [Nostocaceae cyanobacterium]|nr:phage portal protein [Nostocaceae cyanobacterium]